MFWWETNCFRYFADALSILITQAKFYSTGYLKWLHKCYFTWILGTSSSLFICWFIIENSLMFQNVYINYMVRISSFSQFQCHLLSCDALFHRTLCIQLVFRNFSFLINKRSLFSCCSHKQQSKSLFCPLSFLFSSSST